MSGADFLDDVEQMAAEVAKMVRVLPGLAGSVVLEAIDDNFRSQSFFGAPWEPRKNDPDPGRAILVQSGRLRRSFNFDVRGRLELVISSDAPYAEIHNEGGQITGTASVAAYTRRSFETDEVSAPGARKPKLVKSLVGKHQVRAHTRTLNLTIPQRQFLGEHPELEKRLRRLLDYQLSRIFGA